MVTAKRKISNEKERYGGFSEIEVNVPKEEAPSQGQSFYDAQYKKAEMNMNFTQLTKKEEPIAYVPQEPIANQYVSTSDDVMPKIRSQRDQVVTPQVKQKLDSRTKVILGVYISIILLLSALVLTTGILLSSTGARVESLEAELAAKTAQHNTQLGEIEVLSDEENIAGRALEGGMERIESAQELVRFRM